MVFSNIGVFTVGEPAPGVFKDFTTRNDGATLLQDDLGFVLVLHIKMPNSREIFSCQKHTIESAYYAEGPFWLGQIRFAENKKFMFDFPFNLAAYPQKERAERIQTIKTSNTCSVVLINRTDTLVHALRLVTIPPELHESLYLSCYGQMQVEDDTVFSIDFDNWRSALYNRYSPEELWRASRRSGVFGATPNGWQGKYPN